MMLSSPNGATRAGGRLLVLGCIPELEEASFALIRCSPDAALMHPVEVDAVILDTREFSVEELVSARRGSKDVPALIVSSHDEVEPRVLRDLDAVDVLRVGERSEMHRQLASVVELGRARRALRAAEREADELRAALADERGLRAAILDEIGVAVITTDAEGQIVFANEEARLAFGSSVHLGRDIRESLVLDDDPVDLLRGERRRTLCCEVLGRDQIADAIDVTVARTVSPQGERFDFFIVRGDTGAHEDLEAERRRFERLVAMGTMVAGFAHEIRNPVAALLSIAEHLGEMLADAGLTLPHIERMVQILQRIERLVRTSLQFGRPTAPRRARHRPWSIAALALAEVGQRTRVSGEALRVDIEHDLPDVSCDDAQIAQALAVFIDNALDATGGSPSRVQLIAKPERGVDDDRGRATAAPEAARSWVRFEVRDDGAGIPPEITDRVFDPFFTTKPSGTGLGLSIAQQIVHENGGRLELASARGGPTLFALVLPAES